MRNIFLFSDFFRIAKFLNKKEITLLSFSFVFSIVAIFLEMIGISIIPILILNFLEFEQSILNNIFFDYLKNIDLSVFLFLICSVFFLKAFLNYTHQIYDFSVTKKIRLNILNQIYQKNLKKNYLELSKTPSSNKLWLLTTARVFSTLLVTYLSLFKSFILMISISIFVVSTNFFYFSLFFIFFGICIFIYYFFLKRKIIEYGKKQLLADQQTKKIIHESFEGIKNVIIYNLFDYFLNNFKDKNRQSENFTQKGFIITQFPLNFVEFIAVCFLSFFIFTSIGQDIDQGNFIFSLGVVSIGSLRILAFFKLALNNYNSIKSKSFAIETTINELSYKIESKNPKNISGQHFVENKKLGSIIKIENLAFNYPGTSEEVININEFEFKDKTFYIIKGESGSGKSTLLDILMGVIQPKKGKIISRSKNLNVGYVSQECFVINDTLKKNIAFGINEDLIDEDKIINIIKSVKLYDRFFQKDLGLNTLIDANGSNLSIGQKQRLGIARSLYFDPEIFFLDEPTSSLDLENEKLIFNILYDLSKKIPVIMIMHKDISLENSKSLKIQNGNLINLN